MLAVRSCVAVAGIVDVFVGHIFAGPGFASRVAAYCGDRSCGEKGGGRDEDGGGEMHFEGWYWTVIV